MSSKTHVFQRAITGDNIIHKRNKWITKVHAIAIIKRNQRTTKLTNCRTFFNCLHRRWHFHVCNLWIFSFADETKFRFLPGVFLQYSRVIQRSVHKTNWMWLLVPLKRHGFWSSLWIVYNKSVETKLRLVWHTSLFLLQCVKCVSLSSYWTIYQCI